MKVYLKKIRFLQISQRGFSSKLRYSLLALFTVFRASMVCGVESYQKNDLNCLLPPGLHYYKITYVNEAPAPSLLEGEVRELVLMGCHHAIPWMLLEPSQQESLKTFLKNNPLIAHECGSLYHSEKLGFYINFFLDLWHYSDIILNSTFIRYSEYKYNRQNSASEIQWIVDYFKDAIRGLAQRDTLEKLDLYDKIGGRNIANLLMFAQDSVMDHLPLSLVLNFLNCYVKHTCVEYQILRDVARKGPVKVYGLDDHKERIKEEKGGFSENHQALTLLAHTALLESLLNYYAQPKGTIKIAELPNQDLERMLDFMCFLSEERKIMFLNTVASRVMVEKKLNRMSIQNYRILNYEIESFRNGDFDTLTELQINNLQNRNYGWLCNPIRKICMESDRQALVMFGASHLGGRTRKVTYVGILDFFIDLLLEKNQEYWSILFNNNGSRGWFPPLNVLKIQRLSFSGELVSVEQLNKT